MCVFSPASASVWIGLNLVQGETSVKILTSIREKDVFIVQSGSKKVNDSIMELLIMISACKGGSANKITGMLLHPDWNVTLVNIFFFQ